MRTALLVTLAVCRAEAKPSPQPPPAAAVKVAPAVREGCEVESLFARWCGVPLGQTFNDFTGTFGGAATLRRRIAAARVTECGLRTAGEGSQDRPRYRFNADGRVVEIVGKFQATYRDGRLATVTGNPGGAGHVTETVDGKVTKSRDYADPDVRSELHSTSDDDCHIVTTFADGKHGQDYWCRKHGTKLELETSGGVKLTATLEHGELRGKDAHIVTDASGQIIQELLGGSEVKFERTKSQIKGDSTTWKLDVHGLPVSADIGLGAVTWYCR